MHTTIHHTTTTWEKIQKKATATHAVVTNIVPGQSRNPLQAQVVIRTPPPWLSPTSCTHTVIDPSILTLFWQNAFVATAMKPPIQTTLRWGIASSTTSHSSTKDSDT
jgi:hypothetical protein